MDILIHASYNSRDYMINNSIINHNTELIEDEKLRKNPNDDYIEYLRVNIVERLIENEKIRREYLMEILKQQTTNDNIDFVSDIIQKSIFNELTYLHSLKS